MADTRASRPSYPHGALPAGTRLGEFEIRHVLGVGGFGIVYEAFDHLLEREVAVKEYMPASLVERNAELHVSLISESNADTFALGLRSFVNEARLLARFDHPSLLKVHRFWEANGTAYMAMALYKGRTARDVRQQMASRPDEVWVRRLLEPLLGAIEKLHSEDVYHRDIAPDNILIEADGRPVLLDFGAARRVITDRSQTLTAILKPSYAPIEQYADVSGMKQGPWTDIYALGATVHFLLLGKPPPPAPGRSIQDTMPPLSQQDLPGFSPPFLALVDWMLSPLPAERPQSVAMVRDVLEGRAAAPPRNPLSPFERTTALAGAGKPAVEVSDDATIVIAQPPAAPARPLSDETVVMPRSAHTPPPAAPPAASAAGAGQPNLPPRRVPSGGLWLPDGATSPPGSDFDATILQPRAAVPPPRAPAAAPQAPSPEAAPAAPVHAQARPAEAARARAARAPAAATVPRATSPLLPLLAGSALAALVGLGLWWFMARPSTPVEAADATPPPSMAQPTAENGTAASLPAALPTPPAPPAPDLAAPDPAAQERTSRDASTPMAAGSEAPATAQTAPVAADAPAADARPAAAAAAAKAARPAPRVTETPRPRPSEPAPALATTQAPERPAAAPAKVAPKPATEATAKTATTSSTNTSAAAPAAPPTSAEPAAAPPSPSERCAKELPLVRMICLDVVCFRSEFKNHPECLKLRADQAQKRMLEGQ
ncbi:MAG: hypothetical protein ABS84_12555 [Rubrivivax sp. SCN 71-131]|nr:MAG: hypothetical protein ABS84_12555 [Rubrivivax sp. SCN 71-131]